MLAEDQIEQFRRTGHLTVPGVLGQQAIQAALDDVSAWSQEFLATLSPQKQRWYLEQKSAGTPQLRKLDNPVYHRPLFRQLAGASPLVEIVRQLIGPEVCVFFSQVFMKPPEIGGAKPIHQDNFYFGPRDLDSTLTAWIALDEATIENGCLYYTDVHQHEIVPHQAPPDEPFNLQIPAELAAQYQMVPAPVPAGGVSLHHGNTPHQSSDNRSQRWRRAVAIHYLSLGAELVAPALPYDQSLRVELSDSHA